jgi:hypothetical protein
VSRVAICPITHADLEDEGTGFWCTECQDMHPFSYVIFPDDIDDDPDRSTDDEH